MKRVGQLAHLPWLVLICFVLVACQPPDPPEIEEAEPAAEMAEAETADEEVIEERREEIIEEEDCLLTMGWDPWEPYHSMGAGGLVEGLDVDIANALADQVGCDLEFVQGNWAGHLREIQHGGLDLLGGATMTAEREAFAWFSDPYRMEQFELFVQAGRTGEFDGSSLGELLEDGFRMGVTQGFIYGERISELQGDPRFEDQFVEAPIGELHFTRLQDLRIDGFLEDPYVAAAIERRKGWEGEVEAFPLEFPAGQVHFMFSQESVDEELVERFNQALEKLRDSNRHQEILDHYLN